MALWAQLEGECANSQQGLFVLLIPARSSFERVVHPRGSTCRVPSVHLSGAGQLTAQRVRGCAAEPTHCRLPGDPVVLNQDAR